MIRQLIFTLVGVSLFPFTSGTCEAQVPIWNLPESGTWVRYTGDIRQITIRPESTEGDISLQWQRQFEIRCLDREQADWKGETVDCVWIEIETLTGQQVDGQLEAGPGANRIYKILVPEQAVIGKEFLTLQIPRTALPIVKGYRKIGDGAVEQLPTTGFQAYPVLTQLLINQYSTVAGTEQATAITGNYASERIENSATIEDPDSRSTNESQVWVSSEIPFGQVRWSIRITRETKTVVDERDAFTRHSEIVIQMQAAQIGNDAVSKISVP